MASFNSGAVRRRYRIVDIVIPALLAVAASYLAYVLYRYASSNGYVDHIEPNIAIAAWRLHEGYQLYQSPGEWPIFANFYGPLVYIIHASLFAVAGGSIPLSKLAGALASAGSVVLFFLYAKRRFGVVLACSGTIMFVAFILLFTPYSIWNRPDPFTILMVTLALFAKDIVREYMGKLASYMVVGACIGLAVNLKVHSFVYFFPIIIDLCGWKGVRAMAVVVITSLIVFLIAFIPAEISLVNYVVRLFGQVSGRGIDIDLVKSALRYSIYYLLPGLFLLAGLLLHDRKRVRKEDMIYFFVLVISLSIAIYPASIPGSGYYHFLPLFPISVDVFLRFAEGYSDMPRTRAAALTVFPVLMLALSSPTQHRLMRNLDRIDRENAAAEVQSIAERLKGETVQMGYGKTFDNYRFTYLKPILAFAGQPVTIDAQTIMESRYSGLDLLSRFTADLQTCKTRYWLIPKGEMPFSMKSYYGGHNLFGGASEVFQEKYKKTETLRYYDIWSCRD